MTLDEIIIAMGYQPYDGSLDSMWLDIPFAPTAVDRYRKRLLELMDSMIGGSDD